MNFNCITKGFQAAVVILVFLFTFHTDCRAAQLAQVTPTTIGFGDVPVGEQVSVDVIITNNSTNDLTGWAGGGVESPFGGTQNCAGGVSPGESCYFRYTFTPTSTGSASDSTSFSFSSGTQTQNVSISFSGNGITPRLALVTPTTIGFGDVLLGEQVSVDVNITNNSTNYLTGWTGGGVEPPFGGTQNCAGGVSPGESCYFRYTFTPASTGSASSTTSFSFSSGTQTQNVSITLTGVGLSVTDTTLVSNQNPSRFGQPCTFTATILNGSNPTGTVQFFDNGEALGSPVPLVDDSASYTTSTLAVGQHTITAAYSGDDNNTASDDELLQGVVGVPTAIFMLLLE